jgi:hypothetical protein
MIPSVNPCFHRNSFPAYSWAHNPGKHLTNGTHSQWWFYSGAVIATNSPCSSMTLQEHHPSSPPSLSSSLNPKFFMLETATDVSGPYNPTASPYPAMRKVFDRLDRRQVCLIIFRFSARVWSWFFIAATMPLWNSSGGSR